jgi:phage terminase large subunit-like protein
MERDYVAIARRYEDDILSGAIPACRWVRLAIERNRKDLARQDTDDFPFIFDAEAASRICIAAENLPYVKGPKAKIVGRDDQGRLIWATMVLEPWQIWILTTIFGWLRAVDRLRRFRIAFPIIPRKNAKSTIAAVVVLFMMTSDNEVGAECYSAATTRDQAKVVAEIVWLMAKRSPQFCDYFGVRVGAETTYALDVPSTGAKFRALSADANTLDALNVSLGVIDELHAHKKRGVFDVIDTATGARQQPLLFPITTAGIDTAGICYEKVTYLRKVLDEVIVDESFFGIEYTIDDGDDWRLEATHRKANPNYGISVNPEDLKRKVIGAENSPSSINNFLTKHLNVWVKGESAWLALERWRECEKPKLTIEACAGHPAWVIVDLAEVSDIAAVLVLFQLDDGHFAAFGRYYLPRESINTSANAHYSGWVREQILTPTEGTVVDYAKLEDDVVALAEEVGAEEILFDRALASRMLQNLEKRCGESPKIIVIPQNVQTIDPAMKFAEELILSHRFEHDGNQVLTWMFTNVVCLRNHKGEVYPRKAGGKDSPHKIDGIFCLLMGLSRTMNLDPPAEPSVYEERGLTSL